MYASVLELLEVQAGNLGKNHAYTFLTGGDESERLTFSELNQRARAIAARLQQFQARGERAVLLYPAGTEYIAAFYGCLAAGVVAVPAYPPRMNRNMQRLEGILEDARPKVILTTEPVFRQLQRQITNSPRLATATWVLTDQVPTDEAHAWDKPHADRNTLAFLQYTSASTSKPKGVMVTHGNILHNQVLQKEAVQHNHETVMVSWLPLFHDMGLISVILASLYNGVPCYLMSPTDFLKRPQWWLEAISRYRATFSGAPDFGYQLCLDRVTPEEREQLDLSHWKVAFNGSEPVRASTLDRFSKTFASCGFRPEAMYPCYGLAENTLFATGGFYRGAKAFCRSSIESHHPRPDENGHSTHLVSCGSPLLDSDVRIVDIETFRECTDGEIGEIWLSSPSVAQGYWQQPEASELAFGARLQDGRGPFLRTGDLGFFHEAQFYITGRLKDLIIIRGRNLAPQDIELAVEECDPSIRPSFVAAVSIEADGGEKLAVAAEVRREDRRDMDAEAVVSNIRSAIVREFAVDVSAVVLLRPNSLPKTSSGKTQRAKVRLEFFSGLPGVLFEWKDEATFSAPEKRTDNTSRAWTVDQIERWLKDRITTKTKLPAQRIDANAAITAYGFDSVEAVSFGCEIENEFRILCNMEILFEGDPTIRQIAQRIFAENAPPVSRAQETVASPRSHHAQENGYKKNGTQRPAIAPEPAIAASTTIKVTIPVDIEKLRNVSTTAHRASTNESWPEREHPFRTSVNPELGRALAQMAMDKTFVRGEGCWLWDKQGRRYLDFLAQYGALPFGFNPPQIWKALQSVQETGEPSFVQPSYLDAAGELATRLLAVMPPGMRYVTFANSGAEAAEAAIKLCRSTTGRMGILAATNGFHGKTLGALSATAKPKYQEAFGAPVAGFDYVPFGDVDALKKALASRRYAGFLVEPIQAEGGIVEPPTGYLRLARKVCREAGTLFVADEIQTGLGRTGAMFVCGELGITPDVMLLAKALGGGLMPIGACISTAEAYNSDFALKHTSTFAGNTLACRAGIATLDLLEENNRALIDHVAENGARLKAGLIDLMMRYPSLIGEVRGRGYLLGLRFGLNRYSVEQGLLGYLGEQEALTALVVSHLLDVEGVRVGYTLNQGGVLRIEPSLTATWDECSFFLHAFERVLRRLDRSDTAALTSQVTGHRFLEQELETRGVARVGLVKRGRPRLERHATDGRFAFLVHPLAWEDYAELDDTLSPLTNKQLETLSSAFADNFDPMVIGETRITGANGKSAFGEFILVPRRADELKALPQADAISEIRKAVKLGKERGAQIVGLGAFTSVVTQGGLSLKGDDIPSLTTGNSFTVSAGRQVVRMAAAQRGWPLSACTVAVIGAGGAIGQALSILLSQEVGSLILLGNPAHREESRLRLLQVTGRIASTAADMPSRVLPGSVASSIIDFGLDIPRHLDRNTLICLGEEVTTRTPSVRVSSDVSMLREADIVVSCTSSTERMIREMHLRPSAVVCDVARPSNVCDQVRTRRPDVAVLDGGVICLPNKTPLGFNASLAAGHGYACMAETFMLAMEHRYSDMSLGFDLPIGPVLDLENLAETLGFKVVIHRKELVEAIDSKDHVYARESMARV